MSTTLPNGLIAIDEGNTAWYVDITANWNLLDQKVGTVNALKPVATSGDYNDLTNRPTIPAAANDGVLTIKVNGTAAGTFSANQAGNSTIDIPAPGDGTLTIKVNGTTAGTFSANQTTNEEINITAGGSVTYATNAEIDALTAEWHL